MALQVQKILLTAAFVVMGYSFAYKVDIGNPLNHLDEIFVMVLVFGRIKRVQSNPIACSFELLLATQSQPYDNNMLLQCVLVQFILHRLWLLINKTVYVVVSFTTAFKNTKQRLRHQWICIVL